MGIQYIWGSGGGGDTVSAYALGTAVNAVEGDKVLLNYSADMLTREDTVSLTYRPMSGLVGYVAPALNGLFVYTSSYSLLSLKKDIEGVWQKASELTNQSSSVVFPLTTIGDKGFIASGIRSFKPIFIDEFGSITKLGYYDSSIYVYIWRLTCSDDGNLILQPEVNTSTSPMSIYRYLNGRYVYSTLTRKTSSYNMYILPGGDGRYYYLADEGSNEIWKYDIQTNTFIENVGTGNGRYDGVSCGDLRIRLVSTSGEEGGTPSVETVSWDEKNWTSTHREDLTQQLRSLLSGISAKFFFVKKWGDDLIFLTQTTSTLKSVRVRFNKDTDLFEEVPSPFMEEPSPYEVVYGSENSVAFAPTSRTVLLRYPGVPVEEPYAAVTPVLRDQFSPSQTLTGFVKENNNGVLAVSTVVDPNAVVPTPPDEYGLDVKVNYGGNVIVEPNGEIKGSVSTAADGTVTISTQSGANGVEADNPLLNRDYSSFEIVVPFKTTSSSTQHLINFGTETLMVYYSSSSARLRVKTTSDSTYTDTNASGTSLSSKKWLKLSYNTTEGYKLSYSTDGSSWTVAATNSRTGKPSALLNVLAFTNFLGDIYFADAYMVVDGVRVWEGTKSQIDFGSVTIGYGYFRNTLTKPSDKYIEYDGGILGKDNILSLGGYTLSPAVYRNADLGNWTSETEAALLGVGVQITGVVKRLEPTVYLWHDLSYITPVEPETLEPVVKLGGLSINGTVVGSLTTSSTGVISGFSESDYFTLPNLFRPGSSPWEMVVCFTTGSDVDSAQVIANVNRAGIGYISGIFIQLYQKTLQSSISYNGTTWATEGIGNSTVLSANTTYYAKLEFTGTAYDLYLSTTGAFAGEETLEYSYTSSTPIYQSNTLLDILGFRDPGILQVFGGSIDLTKSYVKINSDVWWEGAVYDYGTVSLPVSWKNIDNVLYEYPDGFPTTQATELEINTVEGSNNLYATKTGDSCGLSISSTSPAGVDSSAVLGTVELDVNGGITSYTPGE